MKKLWVILGVLGVIFLVILVLFIYQVKNTDFTGISAWFGNNFANLNQAAVNNENLNVADEADSNINEEVEDVGDLNYFTLELGRSDDDIQSKRTYTFYLPVDIVYELQGVDASSSILVFKKSGEEIFKMTNFDYARSEDEIDENWPTYDEYSLVGGHTNILELENDDYEDEMYIFADTLEIDGELAF